MRRPAFTLIELLLVMAITVIVVVLLLTAVQRVREAANRIACANNLHQLTLAANVYQDQYQCLPPNYHEDPSRSDGSHNLFYGPLVRLLPFMELHSPYSNFSFLYYDSTFPDPGGYGWPVVPGGMNWLRHTWVANPFNRATGPSSSAPPRPPYLPQSDRKHERAWSTLGGARKL